LSFHHERYRKELKKLAVNRKMLKNIKKMLKNNCAGPCIGIPLMILTGKNPMMWMMDILGK